uniref:Uncharacterized protein n=1 Tax=Rhizophora mucronata TaxID=61149 RepID=A0A2P2N744_RHIMU
MQRRLGKSKLIKRKKLIFWYAFVVHCL